MGILASIAIGVATLFALASEIHAGQSTAASSQEAASTITGRVTIDNQGAPGITVALRQMAGSGAVQEPVARATTDREGVFKMVSLPAGRYYLVPLAPAYVAPSEDRMIPGGKQVTLEKGENLEGIELTLTPGGVITGRVTTARGLPVIGREIYSRLTGASSRQLMLSSGHGVSRTDDRGIYRLYGLPAGRYIVFVKNAGGEPSESIYHPGLTEQSQARPIEVSAGKVTENIDIKLPPITQTFVVSGRMVDEATGQPIPKIIVYWGKLDSGRKVLFSRGGSMPTDERGEFVFAGILPGRYAAFMKMGNHSEYYSDQVPFEVIDRDVTGLEIKMRPAASLSGAVVIESANDPAALPAFSHLRIEVYPETGGPRTRHNVEADGRFRIPGLPPDKFGLTLGSDIRPERFRLLGVERNGVRQQGGIEVAAGEQVNDLRLIVAYGTGVVNGKVEVVNGALPEGAEMRVSAHRADRSGHPTSALDAKVDARGQFLLEGLAAGVHEINLTVFVPVPSKTGRSSQSWRRVKQTVSISSGSESQLTLVLDVSSSTGKEVVR